VLVVVNVMPRVAMVAVNVVEVVLVRHRDVPAALRVHVHMPRVRDVGVGACNGAREHAVQVVHVVLVNVMDVAVVEKVHVILVRHCGMAAEAVVHVGVLLQRPVESVVGHRYLRAPR
jgi:hypothetical protein